MTSSPHYAIHRSGKTQRCPLSQLLFNKELRSLDSAIRQENGNKMYKIGKEERKLSIFTDDTILYVENPKEHTNKLLELKMVSQGCH